MKTMRNLFNNKKGFTLVEMVITTLILSILMGITMGMISSSGRMFSSTAEVALDKMVGDAVFESLESMTKYATHIEIADSKEDCTRSYNQGFYIDETDDETNSGKLMYDAKTPDATRYLSQPYADSFYQNRTIKYIFEPYKYSDDTTSDRHMKITVIVCRDGQQMYKRSNTVKAVNLGLLGEGESSNLIISNYNVTENQYINFSCDEQLVLSEVDGYDVSSNSSRTMSDYNVINSVLAASLNEAYVTYPDNETARTAAMNLAASTAREEIKELFGGYVPISTNYGASSPLRFFNGVKATREEVFYGTLMKYYAVDGKVTSESFQKFKTSTLDNTTFSTYPEQMVQLTFFIMNDNFGFDDSKKLYSPSQILDFNVYSVRWDNWFKKSQNEVVDLTKASNSLGQVINGKRSFNNAYIVFHIGRNTWYYQPSISTVVGNFFGDIVEWGINLFSGDDTTGRYKYPKAYDISTKSSTVVMTDIDSNSVGTYEEEKVIGIGFLKFTIKKVNQTSGTLWNALPAREIDSSSN